jgi:tRNA 2-(methylsulfanyl)-N6-isopentenyladenosine37 hydroxylase
MLGLKLPTDPRWADVAQKSIAEILIDHAYCEQKAASSCIALIVNYPEREELVEMKKRNIKLGTIRKDEYVEKLMFAQKKGGSRDQQLVEKLLTNALIEARSCERFRILSENIEDTGLKKFYYELMISEAGHYVNFITLAKCYMPEIYVKNRLQELLETEAEIMKQMDIRGDRMH